MTSPTYPYPDAPRYRLLGPDGALLLTGTELQCWRYLHHMHGFSVSHALVHEGFRMEPEEGKRDGA